MWSMGESYSLYPESSAGAGGEGEEQGQELERIGGQFHAGSMFSFGVSQRGAKKLIYDRYEYIKDREFPLSTNWRCALFKRYNCRARAITKVATMRPFSVLRDEGTRCCCTVGIVTCARNRRATFRTGSARCIPSITARRVPSRASAMDGK
ncbi:uncharacterized protein LOC120896665 [Anopheles arabiensis]|uniref:uncharacterized protein LOC120896665 n=1 Tax=Anopheles arabiensis TaxID=7173 RepID=UPI001AAC4850|nr:uncharacterized protein LOC120896665 [Anopheles arabiensis]